MKQEAQIPPECCPAWTLMRRLIRQPPAAALHSPQAPAVPVVPKQRYVVQVRQQQTPVSARL